MWSTFVVLVASWACKGTVDTQPDETDVAEPCTDLDGDESCAESGDCDDTNPLVGGNADDIPYNGRDEDCDGSDLNDVDGDGYVGESADGDDCNDGNPTIHPGAEEECYSTTDFNCDGTLVLDDCDNDGYGRADDCDDQEPSTYPGAADAWYDGVDSDCERNSDYDRDADGDDHEDWGGGDCDDLDPTRYSDAPEPWDGIDQDCDGLLDSLDNEDVWKNYDGAYVDYAWTSSLVVLNDYDGDDLPEIFAGDLAKRDSAGDVFTGGGYFISTGLDEGRTDQVEICEFNGSTNPELFGWSADNTGDLDGDGLDDLVVGAPFYADTGASLVFLGADMRIGGSIRSTSAHAELYGVDLYAGLNTARLGDLDGDGINEVGSGTDLNYYRQIAVYRGSDVAAGGTFTTTDALATSSETTAGGGGISGDVDLDGDGGVDVLIGRTTAPWLCPGCSDSRIYITPAAAFLGDVSLASDLYVKGDSESGLGQSLGVLGDATGDGYPELLAADPLTDGLDGTEYGGTVWVIDGDDLTDRTHVDDLATWKITADVGSMFLRVNRRTADHDADGTDDVMIGAPGTIDVYNTLDGLGLTPNGRGYVYWFRGDLVAAGGTAVITDADATFYSQLTTSTFGLTFDVGDYNGDGRADLAVGAPLYGYGKLFLFDSEM